MPIETSNYTLLGERLKLTAPNTGYRGGIDPILLASFAKGEGKILDLGCGIGTAGLALAIRCPNIELEMLDIAPHNIDLAKKNATDNNISVQFHLQDVKEKTRLPANHFDEIIINPPYFEADHYFEDDKTRKSLSNHEGTSQTSLKQWIDSANYTLHAKGYITMIHRAERLSDILEIFKQLKFGDIQIMPLWPRAGEPAKLILIQARKGSKKNSTLHAGLTLHKKGKEYTDKTKAVLYEAEALFC